METSPAASEVNHRPALLTMIGVAAIVAGVAYAGLCIAMIFLQVTDQYEPFLTVIAGASLVLAVIRFSVGRGLLRLRRRARIFEVAYSVVWVLVGVYAIRAAEGDREIMTPAAASLTWSVFKAIYLSRRSVRDRFAVTVFAVPVQEPEEPLPAPGRRKLRLVAGIAILAAIVVAGIVATNFMGGLTSGRSRQKRTLSDMRSISTAIEAYGTDANGYPAAGSLDALVPVLVPRYIRDLPREDGWGNPYRFASNAKSYRLASAGKGGDWDRGNVWDYSEGATQSPEDDLVYGDGMWIRYPAGATAQ